MNETENKSPPSAVHATPVEAVETTPTVVSVRAVPQDESRGICRGCGREFVRERGVTDSQQQYYRCPECSRLTIGNFCQLL